MAYVNVAEWKTDQVCEWLKGLDNSVLPYVHSFMNHGINGQQLLNLRSENLEHLGVLKLGHQEIILEAVEYLRNFHYELDRENLQLLALRLSCQAHSLYKELSRQTDSKPVTTQTLSDVVSVVMTVKPVVRWLDRSPFSGQLEYNDKKTTLMKLSLEMATCAQRDRFAEKPIEEIRTTCEQLAKLADYIIQDITDPMILQPASLDLATLKKKSGDDLGFYILPSFHGSHQIAEIKFGTAAHQCGKMEEGDEIVQINYQTVVGWERKSVLELFRESPAEILLTLKRRPRHTKVYGQIYIKPYRLPSNKKISYTSRWQHNLPSPRPELLTIPDFTMPLPRHPPKNPSPEPTSALNTVCMLDTMATDSSDSDCEVEQPLSIRLYSAKPRNLVQRRATITGASPTTKYGIDIEQFWKELKQEHNTTFQLRDKAASCAHGLDNVLSNLRPQTCLGIEQTKRRKKNDNQVDEKKVQFQEKLTELDVTYTDNTKNINHDIKEENKFPMKYHENSIIANKKICTEISQTAANTTSNNNLSDISVPLDECNNLISDRSNFSASMLTGKETDTRNIKERGKLDKSYSTPAYDLMNIDDTLDRKLMLFENSFCKTDIPIYISTLKNLPNINSTKTDGTVTLEDMEDTTKAININNKDNESVSLGIMGNVAQKINNIEKYIQYNDTEESMCVFKVPEQIDMCRNSVCIKVNDISFKNNTEKDQSNIECIIPDKNKCVKYHIMNNLSIEAENSIKNNNSDGNFDNLSENYSSSREDSEEKSESTSSYLEGCSSNSEDITIKKFDKVLQSVDCVLTNQAKVDKKYLALLLKENTTEMPEQASSMYTYASDSNDLQYIVRHISQIRINSNIQNNDVHDSCSNVSEDGTHHCQYTELSNNMNRRIEVKSQLTPPEPPPRKYFTKSETPNLGSISKSTTNQAKPQIPLKPHVRRDLKKTDIYTKNQIKSVSDYNENESFSVYSNLTEKSLDFIDESNLVTDNNQKSTLPINNSAFSESNDKQLNEEKLYFDKYEPFVEKFATTNQSTFECCKSDNYPRNIDFLYSPGYSKQAQLLDFKSSSNKLSEKDKSFEKGVVNKAMMVARSIGLHGSLNKSSSNSPRSNRKRNMLLAKKRNVSVKDVGTGDLEGWLTYRSRGAGGAWAKAWFVLKCSSLYRFKTQISTKADCLIALPGFTISQATEVKSRKYAFKVYHTGTVFYFAADTEDCLNIWLDAVNKATLGTDSYNRNSSLFSETDESDGECKSKPKFVNASDIKINAEKSFGSLKKVIRKESNFKDHEIGASLDRKYLRFLSTRNQNIPVPTAQFRSYRRVLPSTVNKKQDSTPNSPDLQVTIAGSTFYGLSTSQSTTDMSNTNQDMGDYRRTSDRCISHRVRRPDDLHGFITLEEFMLSQQDEEQRQSTINRSASPHNTPLSSDHIHIQHTNFSDTCIPNEQSSRINDISSNNEVTYYQTKNSDETPSPNSDVLQGLSKNSHISYKMHPSNIDFTINQNENKFECTNEKVCIKCQHPSIHKKKREPNNVTKKRLQEILPQQQIKQNESSNWRNVVNEHTQSFLSCHGKSDVPNYSTRHRDINLDQNMYVPTIEIQSTSTHEINNPDDHPFPKDIGSLIDLQVVSKKLNKNKGYSGSNSDLTSFVSSETLQRAKKDASISRKGSFNLTNRDRDNSVEKHWLDSLRRDKKNSNCDKNRLKNVAQYQPPPIPTTPFEQEGMRAAFEMHLDKNEQVQKANRLKSLFGTKCYQKPCTLNLPKDSQKTLLGSPRLHRALFREKSSSQQQHRLSTSSGAQSPGDSRISQSLSSFSANSHFHNPNHMYSSVNSINDVSSDSSVSSTSNTSKYNFNQQSCQKGLTASGRKSLPPPKLPYIPPPTSPPPDYPGLEYPPVFEPGTYSLSDASLLRNRSKSNHNNTQ